MIVSGQGDFLFFKLSAYQLLKLNGRQFRSIFFQEEFSLLLEYGKKWTTWKRQFLQDPMWASFLALAKSIYFIIGDQNHSISVLGGKDR